MSAPVIIPDLSDADANQMRIIFEGGGAQVNLVPSQSGTYTLVATYPTPTATTPGAIDGQTVADSSAQSLSGREVDLCEQEWRYFGCQEYNMAGEVVTLGHKEQEAGYSDRIAEYWWEGTGTRGVDGRTPGMPWSAAFISWIMKQAGAGPSFRYSTLHSVYIYQAIRDRLSESSNASYWAWRLNERKPAVGDIVCWSREPGVDYNHQQSGNYAGHGDIIVAVETDKVWIIGGNVGNSVTKRPLPLTRDGFVAQTVISGETLFAIMHSHVGDFNATTIQMNGPPPQSQQSMETSIQIAWGKAVSPELKKGVIDLARRLECDPNHLMAAMAFETGESFDPKCQNPSSRATGLIQFMPATAASLGTSIPALLEMTAREQLVYVEKYLSPYARRMRGLSDVYMAILYPAAIGDPDSRTLFAVGSRAYVQNAGLDVNTDGVITKGEAASKVQSKLDRGLSIGLIG